MSCMLHSIAHTHHTQRLEQLIVPNCKKIPNKALCDVLRQNPSLLELDISNKVSPKVDATVVQSLAHSCRFLRVLKLSDFRIEDPKCLLVLCGRVIRPASAKMPKESEIVTRTCGSGSRKNTNMDEDVPSEDHSQQTEGERGTSVAENGVALVPDVTQICSLQEFARSQSTACSLTHGNLVFHQNRLCSQFSVNQATTDGDGSVPAAPGGWSGQNLSPMDHQSVSSLMEQLLSVESSTGDQNLDLFRQTDKVNVLPADSDDVSENRHPICQNNYDIEEHHSPNEPDHFVNALPPQRRLIGHVPPTKEEQENLLARRERGDIESKNDNRDESSSTDSSEGGSDVDLYENDDPVVRPLRVEDHSSEFGCLELETLWLDNVNLNDQVCATLLQSLPCLRDLNLSDTDICNPWRLLDPSKSTHLKLLQNLDVKSTALSRTALEMIPKFHPDLHKFSISSTTLPPHTYANIGKLTGVANLELIGGQFYPCAPAEIFEKGIAPAVSAIGIHLLSLNLTYFAHVNFEVIALNCPRIEHLDLSFTTVSVSYPCVSLGDCCLHLVSLNLGFSHIDSKEGYGDNAHPVPVEKALEKMIGQPKSLEELDLSGLMLTDETVKNIFPVARHPLSSINLSRCPKVTIAGLQHIWEVCPRLRSMDITHCREITLSDFQNFKKRCHRDRPVFIREGRLDWV